MSNIDFENVIVAKFIEFIKDNNLAGGTISNGGGYSATVVRDKHGFFKIKYTKIKENV